VVNYVPHMSLPELSEQAIVRLKAIHLFFLL